jgi:hypothetical protein
MTNWFFNAKLNKGVPGFESFVRGKGTEGLRRHFFNMFVFNPSLYYPRGQDHAGRVKLRFMADFDLAQRLALVLAAGDTVLWIRDAKMRNVALEPDSWDEEAKREGKYMECQLEGCLFHFKQSCTKHSQVHANVPPHLKAKFNQLTSVLLNPQTSLQQYEAAIAAIRSTFPNLNTWITWWTRDAIAKMIFPVKKIVHDSHGTTNNLSEANNRDQKRFLALHLDLTPAALQKFYYAKNEQTDYENVRTGAAKPRRKRKK